MDFSRFDRFKARRKAKHSRSDVAASTKLATTRQEDHSGELACAATNSILTAGTGQSPVADTHLKTLRQHRRGQQQQLVDQQIWHLHARIIDKLLAEPELFTPLPAKLEQARQQGLLRHSEYLFWHCAFELFCDPTAFRSAILSQEPGPCKYRRRTRLVGILTEEERLQVLRPPPI